MRAVHVTRTFHQLSKSLCFLIFSGLSSFTSAEDIRCTLESDSYVGNAQKRFFAGSWVRRGICIRSGGNDALCYPTLLAVLNNIIELRKAEYSGAAGVLALLPTIGALFGAPTDEIWTLLSILPFGGYLVMGVSFGGAIMPVRVEDYEHAMTKGNIAIGKVAGFRTSKRETDQPSFNQNMTDLREKIHSRIDSLDLGKPSKVYLSIGLLGMFLLFLGSQVAMAVVEQGSIIPWWCVSRWWMHLWYLMVTLTAVTENIVQLPFLKQHKLYISRVPYQYDLSGGESILTLRGEDESASVGLGLDRLYTLGAAKVSISGSTQFTQPRNTVLVMISVIGNSKLASFFRLISKSVSIAVFITGTAMFASVTLLSLPMAVMVLTLVLSAGVFGRALAGWMVRRVSEEEPMIHVIVNNQKEAHDAVRDILKSKPTERKGIQVEIDGHIFIDGLRVAKRSSWYVATLGVLANPYNLLLANTRPVTASQPTVDLPK